MMKVLKDGITAPQGFKAAGIACGIKESGKKDLALIYSLVPSAVAGMFTSNIVKAAPVILCEEKIKKGTAQAIIVNSGCANACTGKQGMLDAEAMASLTAGELGIPSSSVFVASTGAIGHNLPMEKISGGIRIITRKIAKEHGGDAAQAILTTDLTRKEIAVELTLSGKKVLIGGMAKGSGMINPKLAAPHATMLAFITTDASIKASVLKSALKEAVDVSFNMITVDGDMSTNDSIFIMANGMSGSKDISSGSADYKKFTEALKFVCTALAKEIARDGEGATKLIEIRISGARSYMDAALAAKAVANSPLFKSAMYGCDPNWGRIMAAVGYSGAQFNMDRAEAFLGETRIFEKGSGVEFDREEGREYLKGKEITVSVNLNAGKHSAVAWGCDLSYDYVKINAEYHT